MSTGTDAGSGCGSLINGVVGAGGDADEGAFVDYPSTDGMPVTLDATKQITGTFRHSALRRPGAGRPDGGRRVDGGHS